MLEVIGWFLESAAAEGGMPVCKIKNKFALRRDQLVRHDVCAPRICA
jgi:hypothetical protein